MKEILRASAVEAIATLTAMLAVAILGALWSKGKNVDRIFKIVIVTSSVLLVLFIAALLYVLAGERDRPSCEASTVAAGNGSEAMLYQQVDWSAGLSEWTGTAQDGWATTDKLLIAKGIANDALDLLTPPTNAQPGCQRHRTSDYAVEAEIQIVRLPGRNGCPGSFGAVVRAPEQNQGGYAVGVAYGLLSACRDVHARIAEWEERGIYASDALDDATDLLLGTSWHTYRVEVTGTMIRLMIDGVTRAEAADTSHVDGGWIGLWSDGVQLYVRAFRVILL